MCQALSEGGRRCPIHRHSSLACAAVASHESGLNLRQVDNLFRELRREGRNAEAPSALTQVAARNNLLRAAAGTDINDRVTQHLASAENETEADSATQYAQRMLVERARERGQRLQTRFNEVAARTGLTTEEVAAKFKEFYDAVDVSRNAEYPEEYSTTTRARAVTANLPYDRASVTALERLNALPDAQTGERVRRISEDSFETPSSNSHVARYAYDEGRLEIAFNNDPSQVYAYHNVPENIWEHLRTAQRPGRIYSHYIRGNADYMYESAEAAEADAYKVRCASCGQFRASVHTCPERVERQEIAASGVPAAEIQATLNQADAQAVAEAADAQPNVAAFSNEYAERLAAQYMNGEITGYDARIYATSAGSLEHFEAEVDRLDLAAREAREAEAADVEYLRERLAGTREADETLDAHLRADNLANLDPDLRQMVLDEHISMDGAIYLQEERDDNPAQENPEVRAELESLYEQLAGRDSADLNTPFQRDETLAETDPADLEAGVSRNEDGTVEFTNYSEGDEEGEDEEPEAETPAPRARRTRTPRNTGPEVGSVRPTDNIVVPEQGFQVQSNQYERPVLPERTAPEAYGPFPVVDPEVPDYPEYTVTPDNQFTPQPFDPRALVVYETTDASQRWNRQIIAGGSSVADNYYLASQPEAVQEVVRNAPENMRFVFNTTSGLGRDYAPLLAYDYNRFQVNSGTRVNPETNNVQNVLQLTRKVASAENRLEERAGTDERSEYARAEYREHMMAEAAEFRRMVADGTAVSLVQNASSTRRYVLDANLRQQAAINIAPVAEIRAGIRENKVVTTPVTIKFGRDAQNGEYIDDQGYAVGLSNGLEITGQVAFRRGADGTIEVMNTERQLRCNCYDYRRRYYCKHINYAQRHIGNVVQQMIPDSDGAGRTVQAVATGGAGGHRLMTAPLRARTDVAAVAVEDGEDYVRVSAPTSGQFTNEEYGWRYANRLQVPEAYRMADPDNPTTEEIQRFNELRGTFEQLREIATVENMTPLRAALRRSDVEIPVRASFVGGAEESGVVTGTMRIARLEEDGITQVRERNLQCTCADYRENYDCRHVRAMRDQGYLMMNTGGRRTSGDPVNSYSNAQQRYHRHVMREDLIDRTMRAQGIDREAAVAHIAAEEERARREREEYEERRRQQQIAYEAERLERARAEAEERTRANQETVDASAAYRARMKQRWENVEEGYTANPQSFYDDYKEALRRKRAGETVVPLRTEGVTDGICADEPGARQFGIELEFDIKSGVNKSEALRKIGQELAAAGLTPGPQQVGYHSAGRNGYAQWSFENDCTVDAELVSPLMKDTPEHWEQLNKALEIIKRNGGVASTRTGAHVHVSTASYESSTAKHLELLRTVNNNDDILYRMASSPSRGRHRGMQWCAPNVNDDQGDVSADLNSAHNVLGYAHQSHNVGMNFQATYTPQYKKANVEFRMWDGTLDAATIQQHVALSAAITDYAERNVMEKGVSTPDRDKRLNVGNGKQREQDALQRAGVQTHTPETFQEANGHVGEFLDKIFRRKEDRAAAAALFANTTWQDRYR